MSVNENIQQEHSVSWSVCLFFFYRELNISFSNSARGLRTVAPVATLKGRLWSREMESLQIVWTSRDIINYYTLSFQSVLRRVTYSSKYPKSLLVTVIRNQGKNIRKAKNQEYEDGKFMIMNIHAYLTFEFIVNHSRWRLYAVSVSKHETKLTPPHPHYSHLRPWIEKFNHFCGVCLRIIQ